MEKNITDQLLSVAQMYEADRRTIESGISGLTLMEAAGGAIAREITKRWTPRKTVILCGPGNNGGDGFVVARLLQNKGWSVRVLLLGAPEKLQGDAKVNAERWSSQILPLTSENLKGADLIVDALFGAGLARDIDGVCAQVLKAASAMDVPIVAVDTPSGIHGDSGAILGMSLKADITVTFARPKTGHYLYPGKQYCGDLIVADIGIPDQVIDDISPNTFLNHSASLFPWPKIDGHKYVRGHGVIVGGNEMTGASRLAALCARRIGAGLITIATQCDRAYDIYRLAEAGNIVSNHPLTQHLDDPRKNAFLIGPGLGFNSEDEETLFKILKSNKKIILDADALTIISKRDWHHRDAQTILTPHEGEFKRLFPDLVGSKLERAQVAASQTGAIIILKGADTIIAAPDGRAAINATGTPWLATAGSGDSLAGFCLGLFAQGLKAFDAARLAVWLHGRCAEVAGAGLICEDIADNLPKVLQTMQK